jgi:lipid A disaccharide synthetase
MYKLTSTTQSIFTKKLNEWYEKHKDILAEKTINPDTLKEAYTHQKLVSAYKSLKTNLPYTLKGHLVFLLTRMRKILRYTILILLMVDYLR